MSESLVLECVSESLPNLRIKLVPGTFVVGRSRSCRVYIPDPTVSRNHAKISVADGVSVVDLKSRNGTFVEESKVESSHLLPGQHVRFGDVMFYLSRRSDKVSELESDEETCDAGRQARASATQSTRLALSPAQRRVFDLLLSGLAEKEVAARLDISQHTVHNHTREIYRAVGVHSRVELLARLLPTS